MNLRSDKKVVHLAIALDESGSMLSIRKQVLTGLNEQIQEMKKHSDIESTVTLVTFAGDSDVKTKYAAVPINEISEIKEEDYNPDGMTAMYDGVGRLFNQLKQSVEDTDQTLYLVVVVSDGEENSSKEYDSGKISQMVKERLATKRWSINYIGANQDLTMVKENLGVLGGSNTLSFVSTQSGTQQMFRSNVNATARYMSGARMFSSPEQLQAVNLSYFAQPVVQDDDTNNTPIITDN